ncbi:hypothetical protein MHF_0829 [Mycoplasma haemofelis Ohio2]|uniref:Uncharacterized protein n=1 Tax=Mycoplasma haemofelis (strain Ohio2) TaxID=859194 RepID=F6FIP5_MYCHI|nr:hypothetical protein MHF_0829 [Mycoplasma haemofelis Ohio2]
MPAIFLTTSAATIDWDSKNHARWVEVYFQDSSSSQEERIRVWIEDLGNLSKYSYFKKDNNGGNGKWTSYRYLLTSDPDSKKYSLLASVAKEFLLNQHKLNVLKGVFLSNNNSITLTSSSSCPQGCAGRNDCNQSTLKSGHESFFKELRNLESAWTGNYLSPVTAYIKLKDLQFSSLNTKQENKEIYGSVVYGKVDYDYKAASNDKYFANYPSKFSLTIDNDGKLKKGTNGNDLLMVSEKLKNWKTMHSKNQTISKQCCCNSIDNSFECLLASNFVKQESSLDTIKSNVTGSQNGCQSAS